MRTTGVLAGVLAMACVLATTTRGGESNPVPVGGQTITLDRTTLAVPPGWYQGEMTGGRDPRFAEYQFLYSPKVPPSPNQAVLRVEIRKLISEYPSAEARRKASEEVLNSLLSNEKSGFKRGQLKLNGEVVPCLVCEKDNADETLFIIDLPFGPRSVKTCTSVPRLGAGFPKAALRFLEGLSLAGYPAVPDKEATATPAPIPADIADLFKALDANSPAELLRRLDAGANVNAKNENGFSLLIAAAARGNAGAVRLLLKYGADIRGTDAHGNTALHWATYAVKSRNNPAGGLEVIQILLARGSDINARDANGLIPLDCAATFGFLDAARLLIQQGANVQIVDNGGWTPLHFAASDTDDVEMARLLIKSGVEINARNKKGETALTFCEANGRKNMAEFLRSQGAVR